MSNLEKSKEDRLKEGVSLLKQLQEVGVKKNDLSYMSFQQRISEWVYTGTKWEDSIYFPEYGRVAVISLPKYVNKAATLNFKVYS